MIELFERHVQNIRPGTGGEFKGLCPFHDDRKPSFGFNEEGLFHCFGCKIQGNAIDFAKLVGEDRPKMAKVAKTKVKTKVWSMPLPLDDEIIDNAMIANDRLMLDYDKYVGDLPWKKSIVKKLFIGWDMGFTFPYTDGDGEMVNIKWHKKRQVTGHAQTFIFPYWHMVHKYHSSKTLYVTEGEKDVISLISNGKQAITLNNGCNSRWPKQLIRTVADKFDTVMPQFDNDDPGREASDRFIEVFEKYAIN